MRNMSFDEALELSQQLSNYLIEGCTPIEAIGRILINNGNWDVAESIVNASLAVNPDSEISKETSLSFSHRKEIMRKTVFWGNLFVITGSLSEMERDYAYSVIKTFGGKTSNNPVNSMNYLVVGYQEWSDYNNGLASRKIIKAKELMDKGKDVQIINENDFYKHLAEAKKLFENI